MAYGMTGVYRGVSGGFGHFFGDRTLWPNIKNIKSKQYLVFIILKYTFMT